MSGTRYEALLKVCDMACANATTTGADHRSEFWETLALALEDDCPRQSQAAVTVAAELRRAERARIEFLTLIQG